MLCSYPAHKADLAAQHHVTPQLEKAAHAGRLLFNLTEFDQLPRVNAVYAEYFPQAGPAKLSCGVSALYGGAKFEIQAIALV
jgi:enamine deaminase RidA (YjgF/YER057c/UK114 family)